MSIPKIILYFLLVTILIGATPYFTGQLAETKFQDVVRVLSDADPMPLTIQVEDYRRGWFKSYAKTKVTLFKHNSDQEKMIFFLEHEIRHGPFVQLHQKNYRDWRFARAIIDSKLLLTDKAKTILIEEVGQSNLLNIQSQMSIEGAVNIKIIGNPLRLKEHAQTQRTAWQGIQGEWYLSRDLKRLEGELFLPGFDLDFDRYRFYGGSILYKTELVKTVQGLWPGKFSINIGKLTLNDPQRDLFLNLEGMTAGGVMDAEGMIADFSDSLRLEQLQINENRYGPISYAHTLKNIDAKVLRSFFSLIQNITMGSPGKNLQDMFVLLPQILKTRPVFTIEQLHIQMPQGNVKGVATFAVGGPQVNDLGHLKEILKSAAAKGIMTLPKTSVQKMLESYFAKHPGQQTADELLAKWLKSGALVENEGHYIIDFELLEGRLNLNGHQYKMGLN